MPRSLPLAWAAALALTLMLPAPAPAQQGVHQFFQQGLAPEQGLHEAQVRLLNGNAEAWYARWYVVENAQETLDITYFNFYLDAFGKSLLGLLRHKADQGVKVRLMVDVRGSFGASHKLMGQKYLRELASHENVEVRAYRGLTKVLTSIPKQFREFVASNHDKIIVADGEWAVMGGRNLGTKYFVDPADHADAYIDTDVLLKGEALGSQLTAAFAEEFAMMPNFEINEGWLDGWNDKAPELDVHRRAMARWISGRGRFEPDQTGFRRLLTRLNDELGTLPHLTGYASFVSDPWEGRRAYPCKVLDKHSLGGPKNDITPNLVRLVDAAEERIVIQNAYLVMTEKTLAAFERANQRGVKIDIHTNSPASTSNLFVQAFFVRDWKEWMRRLPNLRIFMAKGPRKIHSKVFVFDDQVTLIGSYNIDPMSETINSEVVTLFDAAAFAKRTRLAIEAYLPDAAECKIRVERDGTVTGVHGPDDYLQGFKGTLMKWISKLGFLRPII